jgi:hypothetical protein
MVGRFFFTRQNLAEIIFYPWETVLITVNWISVKETAVFYAISSRFCEERRGSVIPKQGDQRRRNIFVF